MSWTTHETWLHTCTFLSSGCIVVPNSYFKVHAFIALVLGAGIAGIASDLEAPDVIKRSELGWA